MDSAILLGPIGTIVAILFAWCLFTEFLTWLGVLERKK
jgi:hypothetical protein